MPTPLYPDTGGAAADADEPVFDVSRNFVKTSAPIKNMTSILALCSFFLAGCGGGSPATHGPYPNAAAPLTMMTVAFRSGAVKPGRAGPDAAPVAPPVSAAITHVRIENTGSAAQSRVPLTFGQAFTQGALAGTQSLAGQLDDGTAVPLQVDAKARHADGSLRHAVISAIVPHLAAGQTRTLYLIRRKSDGGARQAPAPDKPRDSHAAKVNVTIDGQLYTASPDALIKAGKFTAWLAGPIANEWQVSVPLKTAAGIAHPHLSARFAIRAYPGAGNARVDVTVENAWAYEPGPQNFTYDAEVLVDGRSVYSRPALTHFHHARWRKMFWTDDAPQVNIKHDTAYLLATKAVPNYDTGIAISAPALGALYTRWTGGKSQPMEPGIVTAAMPMAGGRPDIGPLPQWAAVYLLSMDSRARNITLGAGDLAGSWPIHYRDKNTGLPVSLDDYPYMTLLGRPGDTINPATKKSESFPQCGGSCSTAPYNYNPDANHQPSLAYLPYLVTGDYYYLEELLFWANWNMLQANPGYRDFAKGLVKSHEVRGQGWSLRTLGQAAYITPDSHPMKKYFVDRINNNIDWYHTAYVTGNPNHLGVHDGTGKWAFSGIAYKTPAGPKTGLAPWMDDFFTWSTGYLVELGFTKAQPLFVWKSRFAVGRMTDPGYCWVDGATYALAVRSNEDAPLYKTLAEAYAATMRMEDGSPLVNSTGAKYLDQECGSQAQADWRTQYDKDNKVARGRWVAGEMTGFASAADGFPANMQPALAVAANSGVPNARDAWTIFKNRTVKPSYADQPQWAIVPRN